MKNINFHHTVDAGWSCAEFPKLDAPTTAVLVFGAPKHPDLADRLTELREAFPTSIILGCSTAGEIRDMELCDNSLSVSVMRFEHTSLRVASASLDAGSTAAADQLCEQLAGQGLRALLVLSPWMGVNGTEMAASFARNLPPDARVVGGMAADGHRFERTWVIDGDAAVSHRVTAMGFYGDRFRLGCGTGAGWSPFGPERVVTRSQGNVLHTLDGKPALDIYERYLGDLAADLPMSALLFPLSINRPGREQRDLVRTVLDIDRDARTMTFSGDIPQGARASMMRCHVDDLVDGAESATAQANAALGDASSDRLAIVVSCVGRRLVMKHRAEEELEAVGETLADGTPVTGFFSYGELAPAEGSVCELHNETMTLGLFSEA